MRRHRKARRYTLRIHARSREVVLTMPLRGAFREAKLFAQKHASLDRRAAGAIAGPRTVRRGRGHSACAVCRIASCIARARAERCGPNAVPTASSLLCVAGQAPHVGRRVGDFLKREAKRDLEAASRRAAEQFGVAIKRVSVRDQSSRWGSCSSTGVLSYSWRLILAPPFVLELSRRP